MKTILQGIVGSQAYGFATPESDVDRLGIFALPASEFLGLDPPVGKQDTVSTTDPDTTLHECLKFCTLALKGNPTVSELLWLDSYEIVTPLGEGLIAIRQSFLSAQRVKEAFCGYAYAQLKELERRGNYGPDLKKRTEKHSRHLLRILQQGLELWTTGEMTVRRPNPDYYFDFGRRVAAGDTVLARERFTEIADKFDSTPSVLPEEPDRVVVDSWLREVRAQYRERT